MARNEDSGSNSTVQQSHIPVCYGSAFGRNGCTGINHCLFSVCRPNFRVQFIVFIKKKTQEACAYCLLPRNNTIYGHLKLGLA